MPPMLIFSLIGFLLNAIIGLTAPIADTASIERSVDVAAINHH